jgi:hypothetical protein
LHVNYLKKVNLFTISKKNYSVLSELIESSNSPADALAELREILADHKTVTDDAEKTIR